MPLMHESWGAWPWLAPLWILLWIVVIVTRDPARSPGAAAPGAAPRGRQPQEPDEILAERFARGEIDADRVPRQAGRTPSVVWNAMTRDNSIVVEKLVREFKKGPRAVDGIDLHVAPGRDLRLPRPERRRASRRPC